MTSAPKEDDSTPPPRISLLVLVVSILALVSLFSRNAYVVPRDKTVGIRAFTIAFTVTYENRNGEGAVWNFAEDDRTIGLFMNNSWQTVYLMRTSLSVVGFETDMDGNPIGFLFFPRSAIHSGENLTYEVSYRIVLKPRPVPQISEEGSAKLTDMPRNLRGLYSGSGGPWLLDEPELVDLAHEIVGNETKVLTIVAKFIAWIRDNIRYETADLPRYPNETLLEKTGDCDDQANLLITLCRIVGIPAYLQVGCIYLPSRLPEVYHYWDGSLLVNLTRIGWHGWAMVYVPPWGWLPVDLTYVSSINLRADPLNAVRISAVIAYPTVQYANITRTDYVAASRMKRDFLLSNGFRIVEHDLMDEETARLGNATANAGFSVGLVAVLVATLAASLLVSPDRP